MSDQQIIERHDPSVRARARIELRIVRTTIRALSKAGYESRVWDGEATTRGTERALIDAAFAVDDAYLIAYRPPVSEHLGWTRVGWVRFVFGNDGWDVICDYSSSLESIVDPIVDALDP